MPGRTERSRKGLFAFLDRQGALANGPPDTARCLLWAAPTKQGKKITRATTRPYAGESWQIYDLPSQRGARPAEAQAEAETSIAKAARIGTRCLDGIGALASAGGSGLATR